MKLPGNVTSINAKQNHYPPCFSHIPYFRHVYFLPRKLIVALKLESLQEKYVVGS
jgi:hypothetical protein